MDPITRRRDPDQVRRALQTWMEGQLDDRTLESVAVAVPDGHGFSNDTFMVDAVVDGSMMPLVVQAAPMGDGLFPEYPIARMARIQQDLRDHSDVPVANVRWLDADPSIFGAPFYVMDRLEGHVPDESPQVYHAAGWLFDADPAERRQLWLSILDALARLHRVAVASHFSYLTDTRWGMGLDADPASERLRQWRDYTVWASDDDDPPATLMHAWTELGKVLPPRPTELSIGWGDAKLGNVIVQDFKVAALLDWELVGVGPAEEDLMNLLAVDAVLASISQAPRLAGLPSQSETIAAYEELLQRELLGTSWWYVFALAKMASEIHRLLRQRRKLGTLPSGIDLESINIAIPPLVHELAALSPPTESRLRRPRA